MCVSHWQAFQHYFFVMFRDQSSEESTAHRCATLAISAWRSTLGSTRLWRAGERVLAIANSFSNRYFSRADVDKSLFRRDAETSTPEACATQTNREERGIPVGPLQPRRQVNRRDHAARAAAANFNGRKVKRHESRIATQSFALILGQCSIGATGKH